MSNMSYCRFHNTLKDLRDCYEHIHNVLPKDREYGTDEHSSRKKLLALCYRILEECNNVQVDTADPSKIDIDEYEDEEENI